MLYSSEIPRVVGQFDSEALHSRIDAIAAGLPPNMPASVIQYGLMHESDEVAKAMDAAVGIKWHLLFLHNAFGHEDYRRQGDINGIMLEDGRSNEVTDIWHPDTSRNVFVGLPEALTGASIWPTQFLVGKVAVGIRDLRPGGRFRDRHWRTEKAKESIALAIEKGDAIEHSFEPGEVVKVPPGALHRRNIPKGLTGYRYFLRQFPRNISYRSATNVGRLRFF